MIKANTKTKILLISALPISSASTTRAFLTYFHHFSPDNIAQIYTNTSTPSFEYCHKFFRINDSDVIKSFFTKKVPGKIFDISNKTSCDNSHLNKKKRIILNLGKKESHFIDLLRRHIWRNKKWFSQVLEKWICEFNPDVIFVHNSYSLFLEKMALFISNKINKPLILEISDDYFFNYSKNIFGLIHHRLYSRIFRQLISKAKNVIYISEKMKNKYNSYFNVRGVTVLISSPLIFDDSITCSNKICYFGNTGLGRDKTLKYMGKIINSLNSNQFHVDVYSPSLGNSSNINGEGIIFHGPIPYIKVLEEIKKCSLLIYVESFKSKFVKKTEFSLSTKISDYLHSGVPILAVGPTTSGSIDFLAENKCAFVCSDLKKLKDTLTEALFDENSRKKIQNVQLQIADSLFSFERNSIICKEIIEKTVTKND